jgi:thiamine-monophosphate kinase
MNEFDVIEKYFLPLAPRGLDNDAAVLDIPPGRELVVTSDTLNAGTHFPADASAADIAHKGLRVNLSDLAAMGADPYAYQLNLAFPQKPEANWLEKFTAALVADQEAFGIFCSGGDTTRINGPLSISITALGLVPAGQALTRSGAQDGDLIFLSDAVGDALIGLRVLQSEIETADADHFKAAYFKPRPRLDLAENLRAHAHAAIDVSDGLVADLAHICRGSGLAAHVDLTKIPFSAPAQTLLDSGLVSHADLLTGGDDYVLLFAVPENKAPLFPQSHIIGRFQAGDPAVHIRDLSGAAMSFSSTGWTHF